MLPGGFLYYSDILSTPDIVNRMGEIIATEYYDRMPDFVLTTETKGIPVAFATANALGVPLVIARHSSKVYEGSAVNINYVSGSGNIEMMSLSRRAVRLPRAESWHCRRRRSVSFPSSSPMTSWARLPPAPVILTMVMDNLPDQYCCYIRQAARLFLRAPPEWIKKIVTTGAVCYNDITMKPAASGKKMYEPDQP